MSNQEYAWLRYADLQKRSRNISKIDDYAWGIERALDYLLNLLNSGTVPRPEEIESALSRTIASGARLHRSRSAALRTVMDSPLPVSAGALAEARLELTRIGSSVKEHDREILRDAGEGYTDTEIAVRHASTPGAIRVRLSRLRLKLAPDHHSAGKCAGYRTAVSETCGQNLGHLKIGVMPACRQNGGQRMEQQELIASA